MFEKFLFWRRSKMTLYEKIQVLCKKEGFEISNLGEHIPGLNVTKGSISKWKSGAVPRAKTVKAVADYFGVSIDYLKDDNVAMNVETIQDNRGIVERTAHTPAAITNSTERKLTDQEIELLNIFEKLSIMDRAKLLVFANGLQNGGLK